MVDVPPPPLLILFMWLSLCGCVIGPACALQYCSWLYLILLPHAVLVTYPHPLIYSL